jgi:hypothetical protein
MQQAIPAAPLNPKFAESVQCASVGISVAAGAVAEVVGMRVA